MSNKDHSELPNGNDLMDIDDDSLEDLAREIEARSAPPKIYRKGYQVKHKSSHRNHIDDTIAGRLIYDEKVLARVF